MPATVTRTEIEQRLYAVISELSDIDVAQLSREDTLEALDLDSLDMVEIGQVVSEEWGIELRPEDLKDVKTVGDALDVVLAKAP